MRTVNVKFKGQDTVVRELTVDELDSILADDEVTTFDRVFDGSMITESMVRICTGLDLKELRSSHPSDLLVLIDAVKEVNPDFLSGMANIMARRQK
jgi:hypothetical protein